MKKSLLAIILCGLLLLFSSGCGGLPGSSDSPVDSPVDSSVGTASVAESAASSASATTPPIIEPELTEHRRQLLINYVNKTHTYDSEHQLHLLGVANGYIILYYSGGGADTAIVEYIMGGYKLFSGEIHYPSALGIYVLNDEEVLSLPEAYEQDKIDMDEVYPLLPERMQAGETDEPDNYKY